MSFCPVCGAHHDPKVPCADRAGELLRGAGIEPEPMTEEELKETVGTANRSLAVIIIFVAILFLAIILYSYPRLLHPGAQSDSSYMRSAWAWMDMKEYENASADFTEAIRVNPKNPDAYYGRGGVWLKRGNYDEAITDYTEAIRLKPKFAYAYYGRGIAWYFKGNYDKAIADESEAIRLNPYYARFYRSRGVAKFDNSQFYSAAADLARERMLKGDIYAAIWLYLAQERSNGTGVAGLKRYANSMDEEKWPAAVIELFLGETKPAKVLSQAADPDPKTNKGNICEADFFLGEWHILRNERQEARRLLNRARDECPRDSLQYESAIAELERLKR
jgi:lipoprotein NlpI